MDYKKILVSQFSLIAGTGQEEVVRFTGKVQTLNTRAGK